MGRSRKQVTRAVAIVHCGLCLSLCGALVLVATVAAAITPAMATATQESRLAEAGRYDDDV